MYALDGTRVLRRYRTRTVPEAEVTVMRYAREHGYPVPEVFAVDGPDLVMERVDGPMMQTAIESAPHELDRYARTLAALHERLHTIEAPQWLRPVGPGTTLLHGDLHPRNVLLGRDGPIVIDWANASRGHWADDVAQSVVIMKGAFIPEEWRGPAAHFIETYLAAFDRDTVRAHLPAAIARRTQDPNLSEVEYDAARTVTV